MRRVGIRYKGFRPCGIGGAASVGGWLGVRGLVKVVLLSDIVSIAHDRSVRGSLRRGGRISVHCGCVQEDDGR